MLLKSNGYDEMLETLDCAFAAEFQAVSPKISLPGTAAQYFLSGTSGLPAADRERRQMAGDVVGVERRAGEGADRPGARRPSRRVPAPRRKGRAGTRPSAVLSASGLNGGLPPAHHLRIEPGGLHGIGPRRRLPGRPAGSGCSRAWFRRAKSSAGHRACAGSRRHRRRSAPAAPGCAPPRRGFAAAR